VDLLSAAAGTAIPERDYPKLVSVNCCIRYLGALATPVRSAGDR
jgi:hypothetical protein